MTKKRALTTDQTRKLWDAYAPKYDRDIGFFERVLFAGVREWACRQASGETLELAVGTGRNLAFYPDGVALTGIELSEQMLEIAKRRAIALGRHAELRAGDAQSLDFADASFDTVLITLGLCVIPDERAAVAEAWRVLRPGGRLLAVEHVASPNAIVRGIQRGIEALTFRWTGDHQTREPLVHLRRQGFAIEELRRSKLGIVERVRARKP